MLYHWELDFGTEHVNIGTENDEPVWTYVHSWHHHFHQSLIKQRNSFNHRCVMTVGLSRSSECSYVCTRKWWHPVQSWISLEYDRWCHLIRTHLSTWNLWCDDPMVYLKIHIQRCSEFLKPEYSFGVRVIVSQTLLKLVSNQCKTSAIVSLLEEFGDSCNEVVVTALCEMWRKGGLWCVSARFVCSSGMTEPWYRGGITLVLNYVWLLIAAIHYTLPLYVILWYGHIAWYRFEHLDWRPSENWDHWVKNASTWSWSHDISVSSHVLSFYFGDYSCLRRIWPS